MSATLLEQPQTQTAELPLVCVYVITYDGKRFLQRCFQTLQQLTDYGNYRLLLADNGSSDGSGDFVRENFPGVDVLRIFPNAGYAHAANEAIRHAKAQGAKYVALLNDDIAILHSSWLRQAVAHAERDPNIGVVTFVEVTSDEEHDLPPQSTTTEIDYINGFAVLFPVELFDHIGLYDEIYFMIADEDDLGARAQAAGYKLVRLGIPIYHLGGGTNQNFSRRTAYLQMRNGIRFCLKNRHPAHALLRAVRILDVACNPWPFTFVSHDDGHRRMRNSGNVIANAALWLQAVAWNIIHLPQTIRIRAAHHRLARAAAARRANGATAPPVPAQNLATSSRAG